ncbi:cobalamin biosynthesis protein CobQ [Intrasporangium chromatireducens Q5-1]|uniref:Cobyric acid synthase n=1 Tax=Intrasporangium chromatireducens Q5-1 TaxID=584657 RepID=W9GPU6_9MICO|nr:cobyric acid synthase [Intrasporangium chromatireducens]EWT07057.1 cobalamin biosynthesis protein CobQ [Intrasporangium chromatireducens Q5-1]
MSASGILVAGTSSDAGKSVITAGLCRVLARRGLRVAPFKAQNMSNNSMVCLDGGEIGRAQYLQAQAAGVVATTAMNPVLLKPGSDRRSFIVVRGRPAGVLEAGQYAAGRALLADAAFAAYEELADEYDLVVCEGAGSPAEINLRQGDFVNLGLARRFDLPVVVVGDIDRGGILASLYGTWALLSDEDRALLKAFVINKFRGDVSVLEPGLAEISRRTGVPFVGVIPWLLEVWLDSEDTLATGEWRAAAARPAGAGDRLTVAVVRLPRISNATDVDALAAEPGVDVLVTVDPALVEAADLVVLPGTRSTTIDLAWLHERGLGEMITRRAAAGRPVLGICGGYQMLGQQIEDDVEGQVGVVPGLGLLPIRVEFGADKVLARPVGTWQGHRVEAYEIHHGIAHPIDSGDPALDGARPAEPFLDGWQVRAVWGTMWHGAFENDAFRRAWLSRVAEAAGSRWRPDPDAAGFAARREHMLEVLADALEEHLDVDALLALTRAGLPQMTP